MEVDKNGVMLNVPIEVWNHGIDAIRYVSLKTLSARIGFQVERKLPIWKVELSLHNVSFIS